MWKRKAHVGRAGCHFCYACLTERTAMKEQYQLTALGWCQLESVILTIVGSQISSFSLETNYYSYKFVDYQHFKLIRKGMAFSERLPKSLDINNCYLTLTNDVVISTKMLQNFNRFDFTKAFKFFGNISVDSTSTTSIIILLYLTFIQRPLTRLDQRR